MVSEQALETRAPGWPSDDPQQEQSEVFNWWSMDHWWSVKVFNVVTGHPFSNVYSVVSSSLCSAVVSCLSSLLGPEWDGDTQGLCHTVYTFILTVVYAIGFQLIVTQGPPPRLRINLGTTVVLDGKSYRGYVSYGLIKVGWGGPWRLLEICFGPEQVLEPTTALFLLF